MVDARIVGNPEHPRQKLPFLVVLAVPQDVHDFDEDILEQVCCQIMVPHKEVQLGVHLVAVAGKQGFEGALVALLELRDERAVWGGLMGHDTTNCARTDERLSINK